MWRAIGRIAIAGVVISLAGCIEFIHGAVDTPLENDKRLNGFWEEVQDKKDHGYLFVVETSPTEIRIAAFDDASCEKVTHYAATRTDLEGRHFLDIRLLDENGRKSSDTHLIVASYTLDDAGRLSISLPDEPVFTQAIKTGDLAGHINGEDPWTIVTITAATLDVRRFLAAHPLIMTGGPTFSPLEGLPATARCQKNE